ncbi:phosphotransferase family protein [uncultured Desulfosarcina sp.]|uniref:phosphotransferase family protein n=1 Tax=uncultured Desulfosarcina sp. TaxID=218289 RepID=UPI0029C7B4AA|nr:phosphotransferase family protein [uncultured Desulfosarcina sp.]
MSTPTNKMDQARAVRQGESLDVDAVATYLKATLKELDGPVSIRQFHSGYSNLTYLISVGARELVLRRPPFGKKARSAHDMNREYCILSALAPVFPYVPSPLAYCDEPAVMDVPFYVMERLSGVILRKTLPEGPQFDAVWADRLCRRWVDVLAELHRLDYQKCGLAELGNPEGYVNRQVQGWSARYRDARTDDVPDFEAVMAWLAANMPSDHPKPALIHNDYKFDNVILDPIEPDRIIGVLDWEMATVGDPLMDLGASLAYWIESGDSEEFKLVATMPTDAPGMMTRRQIVAYYEEKTGTTVKNFSWYYCFGLFRLAVIAQQIYYRFYHGQTTDPRFEMLGLGVGVLEKAASRVMGSSEY